jgi:hypothetical protein
MAERGEVRVGDMVMSPTMQRPKPVVAVDGGGVMVKITPVYEQAFTFEYVTIVCTPRGCGYPERVGLLAGVDVSIDGDVWPGSPYAEHIKACPWHAPAPEPHVTGQ